MGGNIDTNFSRLKKEVERKCCEGENEASLLLIKEFCQKNSYQKELAICNGNLGRWNHAKRDRIEGISSPEDFDLINNNIRKAVTEVIHMLSERIDEPFLVNSYPHYLTRIPRNDPNMVIVGREKDLDKLADHIASTSRPILLNAPGGVGKTTLAMDYLERFEDQYDHVAWITQTDDDAIREAFTQNEYFIEALGLQNAKNIDSKSLFKVICQKLKEVPGKNLLVIDNADERIDDDEIIQALPLGNWKTLVTSRFRMVRFDLVHIGRLHPDEAKELFCVHCPSQAEAERLGELLYLVDYHTLAIELIAKTIEKRIGFSTVETFIQDLNEKKLGKEELQVKVYLRHHRDRREQDEVQLHRHLIYTFQLWNLDSKEIQILQQFSVLPPNPQPVNRLKDLLGLIGEKEKGFIDSVSNLLEAGWLRTTKSNDGQIALSIHRMVRKIILIEHQPKWEDVTEITDCLTLLLDRNQTNESPVNNFFWIPFGKSIVNAIDGNPPAESRFFDELGWMLAESGEFKLAEKLLKTSLQSAEKAYVGTHPIVSMRQSNLGMMYRNWGKSELAARFLETALRNERLYYGDSNSAIGTTQSNLGLVYLDQRKYLQAIELLEHSIQNANKNLGPFHYKVSTRRSNLAIAYRNRGNYDKAVQMLENSLEIHAAGKKNNWLEITKIKSGLAMVYKDQEKFDKAEALLESALRNASEITSESHPIIDTLRSNLAIIYRHKGELKRAEKLIRKSLGLKNGSFGISIHENFKKKAILGNIYRDQGDYEKAIFYLRGSWDHSRLSLGKDHPTTAIRQTNLALAYKGVGKLKRARALFSYALRVLEDTYGHEHPITRKIQSKIEVFV